MYWKWGWVQAAGCTCGGRYSRQIHQRQNIPRLLDRHWDYHLCANLLHAECRHCRITRVGHEINPITLDPQMESILEELVIRNE